MTIQEIINILQKIALTQPNVSSVGEGDIYDTLNAEASTRYAYFFITQNRHQQTEDTDRYSLNIFYIDRLTDDKSNKLQIQSIGKEVLGNVFNTFCEDFDIEVPTIEYQVFTERFSDYCAGVYATVAFEVMREGSCADYYDGKYEHLIPVKIINQTKQVKFTANGMYDVTYDRDYTGLENVEVEVDVDVTQYIEQGRQEGYNDGYAQGETEGYGQGYANGYTGGYTEGETQGISSGIEQGRQQVINESEDLYVSENGVYEGANLYKKVEVNVDVEAQYNKGYEDGANAASADAVVLDVSSNGTIYTKYADMPEWNEPETGEDFYSYATIGNGTYFNTMYVGTVNSVVEFWYKYDDSIINFSYMGTVVGKQGTAGNDIMKIRTDNRTNQTFAFELEGNKTKNFVLTKDVWHKIKFSVEGVWVDDEMILSGFKTPVFDTDTTFYINSTASWAYGSGGYFGMVKIDDNVYIPTSKGFINRATGELLKMDGINYAFESKEKIVPLDNLIKQVNVKVPFKAYDVETGLNLSFLNSTMKVIPDYINFEGKTNWAKCFEQCENLQDITVLRNIQLTNAENMFYNCKLLTDLSVTDTWDFSDCTNMSYMLHNTGIIDLSVSSQWNTSKVTNMSYLLGASNLQTVGTLDCTSLADSFSSSPMYFCSTKLKNLGGFLNIKASLEYTYASPARCPDLTKESYINIFNGLYDFTGNGETPNSNQGKIKLHSNAYNLLTTDDIARATAKGWTLS